MYQQQVYGYDSSNSNTPYPTSPMANPNNTYPGSYPQSDYYGNNNSTWYNSYYQNTPQIQSSQKLNNSYLSPSSYDSSSSYSPYYSSSNTSIDETHHRTSKCFDNSYLSYSNYSSTASLPSPPSYQSYYQNYNSSSDHLNYTNCYPAYQTIEEPKNSALTTNQSDFHNQKDNLELDDSQQNESINDELSKLRKDNLQSRKHQQLPDRSVDIMSEWFLEHINNPYPTMSEKEKLAQMGGITIKQVNAWFSNRRNRSQNTKPKRMKRVLEKEMSTIYNELVLNPNKQQVIEKFRVALANHEFNQNKLF